MTPPAPAIAPVPSPALAAFLRGTGRRALLFAQLQGGQPPFADAALAAAVAAFAAEATDRPMASWPGHFWAGLIASLRSAPAPAFAAAPDAASLPDRWPAGLQPIAGLGAGARTALLLALVAGLDEDDGAAALGVDAGTWRIALRRAAPRTPDGNFDEAAWRLLATAARDAQRDLPAARIAWWERLCANAVAIGAARHPATRGNARPRWLLPALWTGVAACVLALAATFLPGSGIGTREDPAMPGPAGAEPLGRAESPRAGYDATFALRSHPDLALLLADVDGWPRDVGFDAWYAARLATDSAAASQSPVPATPASPAGAPGIGNSGADAGTNATASFDALAAAERDALLQRAAAWDAKDPAERGDLRERWTAWQQLSPGDRASVRAAATAFAALPEDARAALRDEFAALPLDQQRGWLLGPAIGGNWPDLEPMFMQVPAAQREGLLAMLRAMPAGELRMLALLSRLTPPQDRGHVRDALLAMPAQRRAGWLRQRLEQ